MNLPRSTLLMFPLLGVLALPTSAVRAPDSDALGLDPQRRAAYDHAVSAFRAQRYPAAYGLFMRLADAGHVPSARLALVMHDHGTALFERAWYASPDQQRRWNALVVNGARERAAPVEAGASD
jgi:hypothetical protein